MRDPETIETDHEFTPSEYCNCDACQEICHWHYGEEDACIKERYMHAKVEQAASLHADAGRRWLQDVAALQAQLQAVTQERDRLLREIDQIKTRLVDLKFQQGINPR